MKNYLNLLKWKLENCRFYEYDGDNGPVVLGSALGALNGEAKWVESVKLESVDSWIELPKRDVDKDFLMPIEDVFQSQVEVPLPEELKQAC